MKNKNSKCYGEYAYLVAMPNENGRAKFIVNHKEVGYNRACFVYLKMSSVDFVSKRLKDGSRFDKNGHSYEITGLNYYHISYSVRRDNLRYEHSFLPWDVPAMKATII